MNETTHAPHAGPARADRRTTGRDAATAGADRGWVRPSVEVISLSCEISAYAPDEDGWPPF